MAADGLLKASRSRWKLLARIPTGARVTSGCIAYDNGHQDILLALLDREFFHKTWRRMQLFKHSI